MAQLQEVHVPRVAEDLAQCLLLWGQHLIRHSKQEVAAGRPLILQILPEGVMCRAACQIVLQGTVRVGNTTKALAKCTLKYDKMS